MTRLVGAVLVAALFVGGAVAASTAEDNGVTATFDPANPNGESGFYTSPVTISFSGTEGDTCEGPITYDGPSDTAAIVQGTCTPSDTSLPPYTGTFTFKYDDRNPTVNGHDPVRELAGNAAAATISYSPPGASDDLDPEPNVECDPAPGTSRPVGQHTVTCTATDNAGNQGSNTFALIVDGAPTVNVPSDRTVEATSPSGAVVNFEVSAQDDNDPSPNINCSKDPGSTFPLGETTVTCTATDGQGQESEPGTFKVTVRDTTKPEFGPTPDVTIQANNPSGYVSAQPAYARPTATDVVDGPGIPVTCRPRPGADFDFGPEKVECTAKDTRLNEAKAEFNVTVIDTLPPEFVIQPQDIVVQARSEDTGSPATDPCIQRFLNAPTAIDGVDGAVTVSHDAPDQFPIGDRIVTFTASDSRGNEADPQTAVVSVRRGPQGPCTVDDTAPGNVTGVQVREGNRLVVLRWQNPLAADFRNTRIYRKRDGQPGLGLQVFRGTSQFFRDLNVTNDVTYVYVIRTFDEAGNHRPGIARRATPHRILLLRPRDQAVISRPPLFDWVTKAGARYYNIQLHRMVNGELRKVLSRWPTASSFQLTRTWRFAGRRYTFVPGRYRWYVWPGFGLRSDANYGKLMGSNSFRVTRS